MSRFGSWLVTPKKKPGTNFVCHSHVSSHKENGITFQNTQFLSDNGFFSFKDRVLGSPDWPQTRSVAEDDLEFLIVLSLPFHNWDYRCVFLLLVLRIQLKAQVYVGKCRSPSPTVLLACGGAGE